MGASNQYRDGFEYGRTVAVRMSAARRADNDRYVRGAPYVLASSPTRAYWLRFRRAMRCAS